MAGFHEPVMGPEVLELLAPAAGGFYLDGTVGGGGHSLLILEHCPDCSVLAVDRDPEALERSKEVLAPYRHRVRFLHARFDDAPRDPEVRDRGLDGALLDLGVSSHQLDSDLRGFAFRRGVSLDMRMDGSSGADARAFIAEASEETLARVFRDLAEEPKGRRLARELVKRRSSGSVETSDDLVAALAVTLGHPPTAQDKARVFQGIRIAVNQELEAIDAALPALRDTLKAGGVLVVIAYHSLEDRLVKTTFRAWSTGCVCPPELPACACGKQPLGDTLTRKPLRPTPEEVQRNPRARSARLRAWRKAA